MSMTVAEALRAADTETEFHYSALVELAEAVRADLAPLPEGEAERMAGEAEQAARTIAPPVPGVTRNAGYTVQAVLPGHPAGDGLLASWYVACEAEGTGWVTWEAYELDGTHAGQLTYNAGHYFPDLTSGPGQDHRKAALRDLANRAGVVHIPSDDEAGELRELLRVIMHDVTQDVVYVSDVTELSDLVHALLEGLGR